MKYYECFQQCYQTVLLSECSLALLFTKTSWLAHVIITNHRTCTVVQATHSVTHTKSYQVIHQLIGTNNAQILRQTMRAEKAEPAPAPQLYNLARPAYFWPYPGPQPAPPRGYQPTGARSSARTALVWPAPPRGPKPAPRRALMCI